METDEERKEVLEGVFNILNEFILHYSKPSTEALGNKLEAARSSLYQVEEEFEKLTGLKLDYSIGFVLKSELEEIRRNRFKELKGCKSCNE